MDTSTSYLGFSLPHPFIAGASPFGWRLDSVKRLEDAGFAAVVLHSLFEEQITLAKEHRIRHIDPIRREFAPVLADFPAAGDFPFTPDGYAEHISRVKQAVKIPIIGSLKGTSAESWLTFVRVIEQAVGRPAVREFLPMQPGDVLETCADSSDLEREVGFRPKTSIEDGTRRFVEWYRAYRGSEAKEAERS